MLFCRTPGEISTPCDGDQEPSEEHLAIALCITRYNRVESLREGFDDVGKCNLGT